MGRTIPSYRIMLEEELKRWQRFQDVLRIDERAIFHDMMDECRRHASAAGAGAFPSKTEGMFLSILFAHHKSLSELHDKLDHISTVLGQPVSKAGRSSLRVLSSIPLQPSGFRPRLPLIDHCFAKRSVAGNESSYIRDSKDSIKVPQAF